MLTEVRREPSVSQQEGGAEGGSVESAGKVSVSLPCLAFRLEGLETHKTQVVRVSSGGLT